MSNISNKSSKSKGTVINRTTSETLRLGEDIPTAPTKTAMITRKKNPASSPHCSFQITCVTRNDFGDDSADDLDESHTDDISRITDNETPSFSEDSRDADDYQQFLNVPPTVIHRQQPIDEEINTTDSEKNDQQEQKVGRFVITKVESVNKGRWTCFDYSDFSDSSDSSYILYDTQNKIATLGTKDDTAKLLEAMNANQSSLAKKYCQEIAYSEATFSSNQTNIFPIDAVEFWKNQANYRQINSNVRKVRQ